MKRFEVFAQWMRTDRCVPLLVFVSLATGTGLAHAADDPEALILRGIELRKKGDDDAARIEFQRAYKLSSTPRAAAQLGLAEQALGDWAAAEGHVLEALRRPSDPWIVKNRAALDAALLTIQAHTARVEVVGGVAGAEVEVNGKVAGILPLREPVRVNSGVVNIVVRAPRHKPAVRTVTIGAGERTQTYFVLESLGSPLPAPTSGDLKALQLPLAALSSPGASSDERRTARYAGIALIAAGAAMLGGGVFCTIVADQKLDRLDAGVRDQRPYDESAGNWRTYQTASVVLYAASGAGIVAGALTYYLARSLRRDPSAAVSISTSTSLPGVALLGRF